MAPVAALLLRERLAIALLALGCLTGLALWIAAEPRPSESAAELSGRVRELEERLLEAVPPSVESRYADY